MKKRVSVFLIAMLVGGLVFVIISQLGIVYAESSITKPFVPEFTVKLVDYSYDVPATQSVDPYTGETVTIPAHRVENRSIEVRIKNQPFTPYYDAGSGFNISLYLNVRVKGHYAENWINLYSPAVVPLKPSNSDYTVLYFPLTLSPTRPEQGYSLESYDTTTDSYSPRLTGLPSNAQLDFQVKAMIGYVSRTVEFASWHFTGEESDWSNAQTITIDSNPSSVPSSASPDSQNPTASSDQSGLNWTEIALFTALGVIVALAIVVIALIRRRRGSQNADLPLPKSNP
ncbi:hypothetical protein G4O51_07145 [Candidatus Bathyarchaeota archaeon A05DMB-2]|jgi:hypothetical protein|nr:hypothetical protein [Candidatus Bathyarchaeota archaeon A05DMB-2]